MILFIFAAFLMTVTSCAGPIKNVQPQINSLVAANRLDKALAVLGDDPSIYGQRNQLLYFLDKALVAHFAGAYQQSADTFITAEHIYDQLYTKSLSQGAASWVVNDYAKDYIGDEYEYILSSIFAGINYLALNQMDGAAVEARRLDSKLQLMKKDDAFARLMSGLFFQAANAFDDARISFHKAKALYAPVPKLLEEAESRSAKAIIYVIVYQGYAPIKIDDAYPIPLDEGLLTKLSFPRYLDRISDVSVSEVIVKKDGITYHQPAENLVNIGERLRENLQAKIAWLRTKAVARPLLKYAAQKAIETNVRQSAGDLPADLINVAASLYNFASEQADLRSWQTLPNSIAIARLELNPGTYEVFVEDYDQNRALLEQRPLKTITLQAGEQQFFISRSAR